jgi:STE24 endopeptidase
MDSRFRSPELPQEFKELYSLEEAKKSRQYHLDQLTPGIIQTSLSTIFTLAMIHFGGFAVLDRLIRTNFSLPETITGVVFIFSIVFASALISFPFRIYHTFHTEAKYGFNRSTVKTFILDQVKGALLGTLIGGPILALLITAFSWAQDLNFAWFIAWAIMTLISVGLLFLSPLLMGLFNKYQPLEEGPLRTRIFALAEEQDFEVSGLYKMDGSKRSSKANAFFAGFGSFRRVALFDTLLEKLNTEQICAVLAHEIGHCKRRHIPKQMLLNSVSMALSFFLVQQFLMDEQLFKLFGMEASIAGSLFLIFSFVITPLQLVSSLISNFLSRNYEYEADAYATEETDLGEPLIEALKILSKDSLSKIQHHPLKAFVEHSHPNILERSAHIRNRIG